MLPEQRAVVFLSAPGTLRTPVPVPRTDWYRPMMRMRAGVTLDEPVVLQLPILHHVAPGTYVAFAVLIDRASRDPVAWDTKDIVVIR